jgi:hypothetical protein
MLFLRKVQIFFVVTGIVSALGFILLPNLTDDFQNLSVKWDGWLAISTIISFAIAAGLEIYLFNHKPGQKRVDEALRKHLNDRLCMEQRRKGFL